QEHADLAAPSHFARAPCLRGRRGRTLHACGAAGHVPACQARRDCRCPARAPPARRGAARAPCRRTVHLDASRSRVAVDEAEGEALRPRSGRGWTRSMSADIAAVLVNYNAGPELALALQSLAADLTGR